MKDIDGFLKVPSLALVGVNCQRGTFKKNIMNTEITTEAVNLTPIVVKTKLEQSLITIEAGIQTLHNAESKLVYNSDHLQDIADFISKVKEAKKKVEAERVALKKPHKDNGDAVDDGAKLVVSELDQMLKKAGTKYTAMVTEQNRLKKIQDDEDKRVKDIKEAIDTTIMTYSTKIAEAKDLPTLLDLERRLNLETANEKKYQEQLPDLKIRCEAIRSLLSLQKQNVKSLGGLEDEAALAFVTGADEKLEAIEAKKEEISGKVEETRTRIQETAINQSTASGPSRATQVYTTVKAKRTTVSWIIYDIELLFKKHPELVQLMANKDEIDAYIKTRKEEITDDNPEIKFDGLKIFLKKSYV